jgi:putative chitinase
MVISEEAVAATIKQGVSGINVNDAPLGPTPPKTGWVITHTKYPSNTTAGKNIDLIIEAFKEYGVTNPYAIVGALSVIGKESGWIPQNEGLTYSKERLPEVWGIFSKTGEKVPKKQGKFNYNDLATKYANNPEKLGNFVYGVNTSNPKGMRSPDNKAKDAIQGNKVWGDGYKYRGRGFNQITWKAAYEKYSKALGVDLVKYPDKLNEPKIAAQAAITFFKNVFISGGKSNPIAYWNNFTSVDEALVYFAKANSGSITNAGTNAINLSREKRKYFDIVKK